MWRNMLTITEAESATLFSLLIRFRKNKKEKNRKKMGEKVRSIMERLISSD